MKWLCNEIYGNAFLNDMIYDGLRNALCKNAFLCNMSYEEMIFKENGF